MTLHGPARRLVVHLTEDATWHHRPLYSEVVHRAHRAGLAGATVVRGIEGFGAASSRVHTSRILSLAEDLPVLVVIVDTAAKVEAFLPELREVAPSALVTSEDVDVLGGGQPT